MPNLRAKQTAALARISPKARRGRVPRQVYPRVLEREYEKRVLAFVGRLLDSFARLENELPSLLAAAARDRRVDAVRTDAGEGKRVRELVDEARRRMNSSILTPELENLAMEFARRTATHQRVQLNRQTRAAIGVDVFQSDAKLLPIMEAFVDTNVGLIRKISDEVAGRVETSVLRAVQDAKPWSEFAEELQAQFSFGENRARVIARDQIGKFYGQTNATRQRELGITHFVWRTSGDERVRDEHEALDGETFAYADPPPAGTNGEPALPGEPIMCRCSAEPVFEGILDEMSDDESAREEDAREPAAVRETAPERPKVAPAQTIAPVAQPAPLDLRAAEEGARRRREEREAAKRAETERAVNEVIAQLEREGMQPAPIAAPAASTEPAGFGPYREPPAVPIGTELAETPETYFGIGIGGAIPDSEIAGVPDVVDVLRLAPSPVQEPMDIAKALQQVDIIVPPWFERFEWNGQPAYRNTRTGKKYKESEIRSGDVVISWT